MPAVELAALGGIFGRWLVRVDARPRVLGDPQLGGVDRCLAVDQVCHQRQGRGGIAAPSHHTGHPQDEGWTGRLRLVR